jgi:hypothetical protein
VRVSLMITTWLLVGSSVAALAEPKPSGLLWQRPGTSLARAACTSRDAGPDCQAIDLRQHDVVRRLGGGYMRVRLVWSGRSRAGSPDALIIGEHGGSGGSGDLFAVTAGRRVVVRKLAGERLAGLRAGGRSGGLHLDLPFDVEYFNGAPHAGARIVPIPTIWREGDFSADIPALVRAPMASRQMAFVELAVQQELANWAAEAYPSSRLFPPQSRNGTPVTLQAMLDLMLTGHADQAQLLLHRAWPPALGRSDGKLAGAEAYWTALCRAVLRNPLWTRLGLDRLPHVDVIRAGA